MKKLLSLLIFFLLIPNSYAAERTFTEISTVTYHTIIVTSDTIRQVDNFDGLGEGLMFLRNEILIQNMDATDSIFCAYNTNFTTTTIIGELAGREIAAGDIVNISIGASIPYHCQAADAAGTDGIAIHIEQASWRFP